MSAADDEARQHLAKALQISLDLEDLPKLPKTRLQESDQLTKEEIWLAVRAVRMCFDLSSCNSGGRNLYALFDLYLRNESAREGINEVMQEHGRSVC